MNFHAPFRQELDGKAFPRLAKIDLTLFPSVAIAAMDRRMMRPNITAYSVAVGPSLLAKKIRTFFASVAISNPL